VIGQEDIFTYDDQVNDLILISSLTLLLMNRSELQDDLITQMLDDMDLKTMASLLYDYMNHNYDKYTEEELIEEVEEYYPHILED
tara:strand:+ start:10 stop:264 length:255 start_codon:yes stop_codon:yes gene_type:complete